jgi:hypothetical protein
MKRMLVSWLLRLYPPAWRKEYGAELQGVLLARPLTAAIVFDVASRAVWQRVRATEASTVAGFSLMLVTIAVLVWNLMSPPAYGVSERIELLQRPMRSEFYVLVLVGLGFWAAMRGNQRPGRAAMRAAFIASIPLALIGLSMLTGVLGYTELYPGQTPPTLDERGFFYTFYKGIQQIPGPAPVNLLLSPLLRLPGAWLWGTIGGSLGRKYANWRRRRVSA